MAADVVTVARCGRCSRDGTLAVQGVYAGDCRGRLSHESTTRDRLALVAEIERLSQAVVGERL